MATKRPRGNRWEFVVRRSNLLDKPLYLTFDNESEGDAYCDQLERLLDQGVIPQAVRERTKAKDPVIALCSVIRDYRSNTSVSESDGCILAQQVLSMGGYDVKTLNHNWADAWITSLKREHKLSPSTIKHHVGALARALDYAVRQGDIAINPLRNLRKGYSTYTDDDQIAAGIKKTEKTRHKRLPPDIERSVLEYLSTQHQGGDLTSLFIVAIESGMRLSELYTLHSDNLHLSRRLARLIKTKNGTTRDVPLSKAAIEAFKAQSGDGYVWPWYPETLAEIESKSPQSAKNSLRAKAKTTAMLSTRWKRIFSACGDDDFTFHYLRHEAASRIMEGTEMPKDQMMKMFGWKSWSMVDRYSHLRASDSARFLD